MRIPSGILGAILWLLLLAAPPCGAAEDDDRFRFRVETPSVVVTAVADGFVTIEADGFDTRARRPGRPDVPTRTVLVAIPPGATPRLELRRIGPRTRRSGQPRPVARPLLATPLSIEEITDPDARLRGARTDRLRPLYRAEPEFYESEGLWPAHAAWLGEVGVLRGQRYVPVNLAPVRYDAGSGELLIDAGLEITVHFDGAAAEHDTPRADETRFEPVYRQAFVNYAQGRAFRLDAARGATTSAAPASSSGPRRRIVVRQNGIVRLDHAQFLAEAPEFLTSDPADWRLTGHGESIPLQIVQSGVDPAALEPGEYVQFYGQALDHEPNSVLNTDNGGVEDLYQAADFSDDNVYFLGVDAAAQPAMAERDATPSGGAVAPSFLATAHTEVDDVFFPLAGDDLFYWLPLISETSTTRVVPVSLPGLAGGTEPATARAKLRGVSECDDFDPDHLTRVSLRNDSGQTLVGSPDLGAFDGQSIFLHEFDWTHAGADPEFSDPLSVVVEVESIAAACPSTGGDVRNDVLVDWIEIDYRRSFEVAGDGLIFDYPDGAAEFLLSGFVNPQVEVYEVTGQLGTTPIADATRLTGVQVLPAGPSFTARFRIDDEGTGALRRFAVASAAGVTTLAATDFVTDRVSSLRSDTTQADLVVVAHPAVLESVCSEGGNPCAYDVDCVAGENDVCELDPTSALAELLAHRATQGISSRVARIGDVEDEFDDGLYGPTAIRNFLGWVYLGGWESPAPAYVMLVGDGSYDYKGGTASGNFVSTQLMLKDSDILSFYASDNLLADVVGDDSLADMVIGRIAARTPVGAEIQFQKILDYDLSPEPGDWSSHALFISDRANDLGDFEAREFERINAIGAGRLSGTPYTQQTLRYWTDNCIAPPADVDNPNCAPPAMRQAIRSAINGITGPGAVLTQFSGHGNFDLWSSDVLLCANQGHPACSVDDTESFVNGGRLPWLLVHNCLTGGFHALSLKSMGEQWMKRSGGGAIAVFAPSGLGFRFLGEGVTEQIWGDLFGPTRERELAVPVMNTLVRLCTQDSIEGCQFYTLLGDPSMRLGLPHVEAPGDPTATAGNAVVDLSWTPNANPSVVFDIYRTHQLNLGYQLLATTSSSVYSDTAVTNGDSYYYYVVARDPDGFLSAWSNTNSDCPTGDDCLLGLPLNLTPPVAPTGIVITDRETGGRLDVSWASNPEPDVGYYDVHYGLTPALGQFLRSYSNHAVLGGLVNDATYHVAVTATNTSDVTGPASAISTGVPSRVLGVKAPDFITDLRIEKAGSTAVLSWSPVVQDIYGTLSTTVRYEVYRGTTPSFTLQSAALIGEPTSAGWSDPGALGAAEPDYYYRVRAVDGAGNVGGLGQQLPGGIGDLLLERPAESPDKLRLWWSPVTTDFDGAAAAVTHYEVYAADQPFGRAEIRDGLATLLDGAVTTIPFELTPQSPTRFYSILAVDANGNRSPF